MIQAVIFDLDGTVLDNEALWENCFHQVAQKHGVPFIKHIPGIGVLNNWKKLIQESNTAQTYTQETQNLYKQATDDGEVVVRPGLVELIEQIKAEGWQTALATGSEWHVVEKELEQLELELAFDITTTGEEVMLEKPDPEIFLLAMQKLGLDPTECVIIEDSVAGVEAAVEAKGIVVGIASEFTSEIQLKAAGAKLVVDNFSEVMVLLRQHGYQKSNPN